MRTIAGALIAMTLVVRAAVAHCDQPVPFEFFHQPIEEQLAQFARLDFEDQYAIYIFGCQRFDPPPLWLGQSIAAAGAKVVSPLSAKLSTAQDDATIEHILRVLIEMKFQGSYDVAGDRALMQTVQESVRRTKDPLNRMLAEGDLRKIRGQCDDLLSRSNVAEFFAMPLSLKVRAFAEYAFEDQFNIYLYGSECQQPVDFDHPDTPYLARAFAEQGPVVVMPLKRKLIATTDDQTIERILSVFREMKRLGTYEVAGDGELVRVMVDSLRRVKDPFWRRRAAKKVAEITSDAPQAASAHAPQRP